MGDFAKELCRCARIAERKGLVNAIEGNLSVLDRAAGRLYITPSRTAKLGLRAGDVAVLDATTGEQLAGKRASSEFRLHLAALAARPDCAAAVHAHPTYLTAYAALGRPVRCDCLHLLRLAGGAAGEIACLPYGTAGTAAVSRGIEAALVDRPVALLGNHGAIAVGADLEEAIGWMEAVEAAVRTWETAKLLGTPLPLPRSV